MFMFILGFIIGSFVGFCIMSIVFLSKEDD
jgi:hypothetical protein